MYVYVHSVCIYIYMYNIFTTKRVYTYNSFICCKRFNIDLVDAMTVKKFIIQF